MIGSLISRKLRLALLGVAGLAVSVAIFAQSGSSATTPPPPKEETDVLHLETNIGSFKMLDGVGKVELSFTGTILISQLEGTLSASGGLRKEYSARDKQAYHGTGTLVLDGKFRSVQWFGTDLKGRWDGRGRVRLYGEFDQNLNTGSYWYGSDTANKAAWSSYGTEIQLPEFKIGATGTPRERKPSGG
jgi:hypothetical protein